jgi:bifunctional UDP-N-acetylglucosamine pyrophosphorylase/glucosamine-1-phosphate N-acetyltransferase
MKLDIDYYFEDIESNELFYRLTQGKKEAMQIFDCSSKLIDEIEAKGKQEIHTTHIGENVKIKGNVYIGEGTEIKDGCIIQGPVYIGENCQLMYHSYIRPGTILGDNCVVGFSTEIKHTIMRDGSKVSDLAFVGDSIIGKNSRIGSGVIVANRGFNQGDVVIKDENKELVNLGREAIGIILGDNSRVGSNCTTSPGTFIGKFTWIYPHTCIHGFIPEQKKVYDKQNMIFAENERQVLYKSTDWNYGNYK